MKSESKTRFTWFLCSVLAGALAACGDSGGGEGAEGTCGDGVLQQGESCDDGNAAAGDGCSSACTLEEGYSCTLPGFACSTTCGDGVSVGDEACDDGNTDGGDGCSPDCQLEDAPTPEDCSNGLDDDGNGAVDCDDEACADAASCEPPSEDCGNGADDDGDGLVDCDDTDCAAAPGCESEGEVCDNGVDDDGDGDVDCDDTDCDVDPSCAVGAEICDNGLDDDGDGDADCADADCAESCTAGECGDGTVNLGEECDDGDANADDLADACRTNCRLPACGDGVVDSDESCDGGERCTDACQVDPCVGESAVYFAADRAIALENGFDVDLTILGLDGDDRRPSCIPSAFEHTGYDAALAFEVPESGDWLIRADGRGTSLGAAISLGASCDLTDELACSATDNSTNRGELIAALDAGVIYTLSVDGQSGLQGNVVIEFRQLVAIATEGEACEADGYGLFCDAGLECVDARCVPAEPDYALEAESCGELLLGEGVCDPVLECIEGRCVVPSGTTCDEAITVVPAETPTTNVVLNRFAADLVEAPCNDTSAASGAWVSYDPSEAAWVTLRVASTDGGGEFFALSDGACGEVFGGQGCSASATGVDLVVEAVASPGAPARFYVGSTVQVRLEFSETRVAGEGEFCDNDGIESRCSPGLFCNGIGQCAIGGDGSCTMPIDIENEGAGDLNSSRGATLLLTREDLDDSTMLTCGAEGQSDAVLEFVAGGTGRYTASTGDLAGEAAVSIRTTCEFSATSLACGTNEGMGVVEADADLRAGDRAFVVVEFSDADVDTSINVRYAPLGDLGDVCNGEVPCVSDLTCDAGSGTCVRRVLLEGDACGGSIASECASTLWCQDEQCRRRGGAADVCEVLTPRSCDDAFSCIQAGSGQAYCLSRTPSRGDSCVNDFGSCEPGSLCVGYSAMDLGVCQSPGGLGSECFPDEVGPQCVAGLICGRIEEAPEGQFNCVSPDEPTPLGESCSENPVCASGATCYPLDDDFIPLSDSVCRPRLNSNDVCTADPADGVCPPADECADDGSGTLRCLTAVLCASDDACAADEWCSDEGCAARLGFNSACIVGLSERQCDEDLECREEAGLPSCRFVEGAERCERSPDCDAAAGEYCTAEFACEPRIAIDALCDADGPADQCAERGRCIDSSGDFRCTR